MNISRGKIRKLRRSKSQSRKKAPKNKKKKRPRTGQNRSFRKKNYINLKNSSLKKLGKKRKRIRFQKGGGPLYDDFKDHINIDKINELEKTEEGKEYDPVKNKIAEWKTQVDAAPDVLTKLKLFKDDRSPFKEFFKDAKVKEANTWVKIHPGGDLDEKLINTKSTVIQSPNLLDADASIVAIHHIIESGNGDEIYDDDSLPGTVVSQETETQTSSTAVGMTNVGTSTDPNNEEEKEEDAPEDAPEDEQGYTKTIPQVDDDDNYGTQLEKTNASKSKIETYVHARGNVSLAKKPALTLYKYGNIFYVKYRYPFIPKDKLDLDYSTEMNTTNLTFKPHPIWNDKPKPSKRSRIPFRTKHDEATYVKVQFHVNLKTPNKSRMQKFELQVPKLSLTFTEKINEVKLQFKDLHAPQNNKIISSKGNNREIKFSQAIDILIPGTQDCMVNNMDSGVYSSLQSIQHRQEMDANQRINKLKLDLNKSKMNEGDATLCANKIRDMEADLLENNAMTISYDPASKNVYVSKVENLTDFAESLKINLDELHDINTNTQDPISHQNKVDSNARTTQMVKDEGMGKKTIMSKSPTIHTPNFIKKRVTPGTSSSTSSDSTTTETVTAPDAESATVTAPDAESVTATDKTGKSDDSSKPPDYKDTDEDIISAIVSDVPDAENTIPSNQ